MRTWASAVEILVSVTQSRIRYPLIDTGSRVSCIDSTLAEELDLPAVADMQRQVAGILGTGVVDVYLAEISRPELELSVAGHFSGAHLAAGGQPYRALIGRDIIEELHYGVRWANRSPFL